jgi:hypothetical protein
MSAVLLVQSTETPNASTAIARNLVQTGEYVLVGGSEGASAPVPRRAFQLPGEPLYLAGGFVVTPAPLQRFLHIPVTTLLVAALAVIAGIIAGPKAALATALVASVEPFLLLHGPVWDDTFLAAALEWALIAMVLVELRRRSAAAGRVSQSRLRAVAIFLLAGWAAVTRLEAQVIVGALAIVLLRWPGLKPVRSLGLAMLGGVVTAMAAWGIRNWVVIGAFVIGSTHDGQTLYQSTHSRARESIVKTGVAQTLLELHVPPGTGELAEDRLYARAGWTEIASHPIGFLETAALKIVVSLSGFDFARPATSLRNVAALASNIVLLSIGPIGLIRWRARMKGQPEERFLTAAFVILAGVTLVGLALGPAGLRYRISLAGFLYLGAGLTVATLRSGPNSDGRRASSQAAGESASARVTDPRRPKRQASVNSAEG